VCSSCVGAPHGEARHRAADEWTWSVGREESSSFGSLLLRHRRAAGLTQEELAEQAGLSVRAISDIERSVRRPRRDTAELLLAALQLSPEERARFELSVRVIPDLAASRTHVQAAQGGS